MSKKDVILAFSGGLDTTYCVMYLREMGYNVHTLTVNTGSFSKEEIFEIGKKAKELGVVEHLSVDCHEELYQKWIVHLLKFTYLRGGVYPPCVGPEREIIVSRIVEMCKKKNINIIAHGSTGAGGDQVRFENALYTKMNDIKILAPIREKRLSRKEEYDYLKSKGIKIEENNKKYSINKGMIGITIGGTETLNTLKPIPEDVFPKVLQLEYASSATKVKISFKDSLPNAINGISLSGSNIFTELNRIGAENGYGKGYHIGRSIIGLKARIAFEAPAYKILVECLRELQKVTLTSDQLFWINTLGNLYGNMVHDGKYYNPLIENLQSFANSFSRHVSGDVTIILNKGNLSIESIESKKSLFKSQFGVYGETMSQSLTTSDFESMCKTYELESRIFNFVNNDKTFD